jgi:proline-specific peptidase
MIRHGVGPLHRWISRAGTGNAANDKAQCGIRMSETVVQRIPKERRMNIHFIPRPWLRMLTALTLSVLLLSCVAKKPEAPKLLNTGEGRLAVHGGNIWYKVTGTGKGIPVVLLHGGPGYSSYYLKPFEELGNERQVVRYDQLGGGKSDKIADTTMFTIEHFVRELDSLRAYLGINRWHVFGHSWGTILAVEYYKVHPQYVASLTLGSAALDISAWEKNAKQLVRTLSGSAQRAVRKAEATKKYDSPAYQNALNEFYGKYVWRQPVPADLDSMISTFNASIYYYMQGPSEFTITGTLKTYNGTPYLPQIKVPVLFTVGEFDEANPDIVRHFASLTPNAKLVVLGGAAHITPWDARDENVKVVRDFLRSVDSSMSAAH